MNALIMTTPTNSTDDKDELIERLADIEHQRWADWQRWCHTILRDNNPSPEQGDILERWDRQIETPYSELSEKEKQSDREQVMRYLPIIEAYYAAKIKEAEIRARIDELGGVQLVHGRYMTQEHEEYLDNLRDSGVVNMFEATAAMLQQFPELTKKEAQAILKQWMEKKQAESMQ